MQWCGCRCSSDDGHAAQQALEADGARRLRNESFFSAPQLKRDPLGSDADSSPRSPERTMILGLRTVIYHVPDLARAKQWYSATFDVQPYFDEPFYVGFNIGGFELGLDPDIKGVKPGPGGTVAYWGVANADTAVAHFVKA